MSWDMGQIEMFWAPVPFCFMRSNQWCRVVIRYCFWDTDYSSSVWKLNCVDLTRIETGNLNVFIVFWQIVKIDKDLFFRPAISEWNQNQQISLLCLTLLPSFIKIGATLQELSRHRHQTNRRKNNVQNRCTITLTSLRSSYNQL